ncbi:lantibiotic dehydratase, partial [Staphylococcus aureus]
HWPMDRIGNVILRPRLRDHEIAICGAAAAPPDRQVRLGELFVSIVNDRVCLTLGAGGRRVIPRLTSAHNFHGSFNIALYRFLASLQHQE